MKLAPIENDLVGKWVEANGRVIGDAVCTRIEWLTANHLREVAISKESGGWDALFQDPDDGRYWERTYPQSESHGGGPPRLKTLPTDQVRAKYQL